MFQKWANGTTYCATFKTTSTSKYYFLLHTHTAPQNSTGIQCPFCFHTTCWQPSGEQGQDPLQLCTSCETSSPETQHGLPGYLYLPYMLNCIKTTRNRNGSIILSYENATNRETTKTWNYFVYRILLYGGTTSTGATAGHQDHPANSSKRSETSLCISYQRQNQELQKKITELQLKMNINFKAYVQT